MSSQYGREGEGGDLLRVEGDARGRWGRREVRARAEREAVRRAASPEPELAVLVRACATKLNIAAIRSKEYNINVRGGAGGGALEPLRCRCDGRVRVWAPHPTRRARRAW